MTEDVNHEEVLDTQGLYCPEPVMMLHGVIRKMEPGSVVKIIATDPSTERDIPKFCNFLGHPLLKQTVEQGIYYYWVQKKKAG
ncbi:sulfurtransferase TusA [Marinomonas piezotolerans]|uniref:Sulfur carrier protein TusA n=1 Tax=Marinomonas piezotolerans TaxID=2213058 RepID=A0A370UDH6_9GAMM|nr:sulfurtransferase TusA [Marinomonas piezotolerans]RDL45840.1 sulfurtransferase TusA [Marinomonas piezotolerans]